MSHDHRQRELAAALGDRLPGVWRAAYDATPRHHYLPARVWRMDDALSPVDRDADPETWLDLAYANEPVITQLHDGGVADPAAPYPISSSASMPLVVFLMLDHLDVEPGLRVLELGAGTGWNAALLAARLGDANVTTVEVDPALADAARATLARAGHALRVVTGDGAAGCPGGAPYDRVIATFAVEVVPFAWVAQARPGAVIVTPWGPRWENSGMLRLTVADDGAAAHGRIVDHATFMIRRQQRPETLDQPADFDRRADTRDYAEVSEGLDYPTFLADEDARMGVGLRLADTSRWLDLDDEDTVVGLWLIADDAWAHVGDGVVRQAGARRLWDEAVVAYRWWIAAGRPGRGDYRITVTATEQTVWLGDPAAVVARRASSAAP